MIKAAKNNHFGVAKLLFENGADTPIAEARGACKRALCAVALGCGEICKVLLDNGADPFCKDLCQNGEIKLAFKKGNAKVADFCVQHCAKESKTHSLGLLVQSQKVAVTRM